MPVGPSHGSSGGRSSFGGGSFSGGFNSSQGSSYNNYRPRSPIHFMFFGRPIVLTSGRQSSLIGSFIVFFLAVVFTIMGFSVFSTNTKKAKLMERDAVEYAEIIQKAKDGEPDYYLAEISDIHITSGFTGIELEGSKGFKAQAMFFEEIDGVDYYYLECSFNHEKSTGGTENISFDTYACYTYSQVTSMRNISFAYTYVYDDDGSWDVVQTNYKLNSNMEYQSALDSKTTGIVFAVVGIVLGVFAVIWFVIVVKRVRKDSAAELAKKQAEAEQAKAQAEIVQKEAANKNRICAYCGNQIPDDADACPACGSQKFKK